MRIRPVSFVLPLVLLIACADAPTGPGDGNGDVPHATGPSDLLVRVDVGGGYVPLEWTFRNVPTFSLYGDGTVITPGAQIEIYPGPALPALSRRSLDEEGIQAILREVLAATDGIPSDLGDMGSVAIADAATTVITIHAGDVERRIEAYALGTLSERPDGMPDDVYRARRALEELVGRLSRLETWLPSGSLGPETTFRGDAARLFIGRYRRVEDLHQEPVAWPLAGRLGSFGEGTTQPQYRCGTVVGDDWRALSDAAASSNELTPWTDGGERYSIVFRPLLPDEAGCPGDA